MIRAARSMTLPADARLIDVGSWLRSRSIVDLDGEPVGGICCRIDRQTLFESDTGEIRDVTLYRVRHPDDRDPLRMRILDGADIDPATAWPATPKEVGRLVRRVCFEIGRSRNRTGIARELGAHETTAVVDCAAVLAAVT